MNLARIIAITGTPGCGKSTLCDELMVNGHAIRTVLDLAREHDCLGDQDPTDGAAPIDVHKLAEVWDEVPEGLVFIDGHLSHLLDVDAVILLRCHPDQLRLRLEQREYSEAKVRANVEWEMLAGTWSEMLEFELEAPVLELDATEHTTPALLEEIMIWIEGDCPSDGVEESAREAIDWLA